MRVTRFAVLTAAIVALCGYGGVADAQSPQTHVLTVRLPDGRLEQVRYVGDVPPTVILAPDTAPASFGPADPFAMLERISAAMDRQEAAMLRTINDMAVPGGPGFGMLPVLSGPGVCARSVQITFTGNGQAPHVVSHTSGDCGPAHDQTAPAALPNAPALKQVPAIVEAKADQPYRDLVHQVGDWQR